MDVILTDDMVHSYLVLICSIIRGAGSSRWLMRKLNQWDEHDVFVSYFLLEALDGWNIVNSMVQRAIVFINKCIRFGPVVC